WGKRFGNYVHTEKAPRLSHTLLIRTCSDQYHDLGPLHHTVYSYSDPIIRPHIPSSYNIHIFIHNELVYPGIPIRKLSISRPS
ncbi:hypothetical protein COCCADRAFT_97913, partial [Bipolaris zeicola 26-R-13]